MSADVLRRAALRIRHDVDFGQAHGDDRFLLAVAAWLYGVGNLAASGRADENEVTQALDVARAYLGPEDKE